MFSYEDGVIFLHLMAVVLLAQYEVLVKYFFITL